MDVVVDMVYAVAVEALATGTIAKFQPRIGNVGAAADGASVGVIGTDFFVLTKGNGLPVGRSGFFLSGKLDPPGEWQKIFDILSHEDQIVGQRNQGDQVVGEIEDRVAEIKDGGKHH